MNHRRSLDLLADFKYSFEIAKQFVLFIRILFYCLNYMVDFRMWKGGFLFRGIRWKILNSVMVVSIRNFETNLIGSCYNNRNKKKFDEKTYSLWLAYIG